MHKKQSEQEKSETYSDQPELLREGFWEIASLSIDIQKKENMEELADIKIKHF